MYGKILGAMAGAVLAMIVGAPVWLVIVLAAACASLAHVFVDSTHDQTPPERPPRERTRKPPLRPTPPSPPPASKAPAVAVGSPEQIALARALCPIFIELARIDGVIDQSEIHAIRVYFEDVLGFDANGSEEVRLALKNAMAAPTRSIETVVREVRSEIAPSLRLDFLRGLYRMAQADSSIANSERNALRLIIQELHVSDEQLKIVTQELFGDDTPFLATLGLTAGASDDDIRAAYKKSAFDNHPDRFANATADEKAAAEKRFRENAEAYDELRKRRGL